MGPLISGTNTCSKQKVTCILVSLILPDNDYFYPSVLMRTHVHSRYQNVHALKATLQ